MMMANALIVGVNGSERPGGNTEQALEHAGRLIGDRGADFAMLTLREKNFSACGRCGDCNFLDRPCTVSDDMDDMVALLRRADGIIYGCPVHGFGTAHLMQAFIERAGVCHLRFERPLANKVGGIIVTGRRFNHVAVHSQIVQNMLLNRMILVGSGYPVVLYGGKRGECLTDIDGVAALDRMVSRMLDMVFLLRDHATMTGRPVLALADLNERGDRPLDDRPLQPEGVDS
jgi:multimeric flavodoxin WrbA